jgi:uncharacterized membrane protein
MPGRDCLWSLLRYRILIIMTVSKLIGVFLLAGFAGWGLENLLYRPRYSRVFRGLPVPMLPVYGFGGVGLVLVAPELAGVGLLGRGLVYGAGLTGLEYVACKIDRQVLGGCSWDYARKTGNGCELARNGGKSGGGCVDWKHSLAWTGLALVVENMFKLRAA